MLIKKLKKVTLAVLIISSVSCARVIPVKLELPLEPVYFTDVSNEVTAVRNKNDRLTHFLVSVLGMQKLAKNKVLCREDNKTLRAIIKTTH